jgi:hypothetical protein
MVCILSRSHIVNLVAQPEELLLSLNGLQIHHLLHQSDSSEVH